MAATESDDHDVCVLLTTAAPEQAESLVRALVEARLVACGNVIPGVSSIYRWEGNVCRETEALLLMETTRTQCDAAVARLRELHAYDTPKILVLDPTRVDADYAAWVRSVTGRTAAP